MGAKPGRNKVRERRGLPGPRLSDLAPGPVICGILCAWVMVAAQGGAGAQDMGPPASLIGTGAPMEANARAEAPEASQQDAARDIAASGAAAAIDGPPTEELGRGPNEAPLPEEQAALALIHELEALQAPPVVFVGVGPAAMDQISAQAIALALSERISARGWARISSDPLAATILINVSTSFDPEERWRTYTVRLDTTVEGAPLAEASGIQTPLIGRPGLFCSSSRCQMEFVSERLLTAMDQTAVIDRIGEAVTARRAAMLADAAGRAAQAAEAAREAAQREAERVQAAQAELAALEEAIASEPMAEEAPRQSSNLAFLFALVIVGGLSAWLGVRLIRAAGLGAPAAFAAGALAPALAILSFVWSVPAVREGVCSAELGPVGLANACCRVGFTEKVQTRAENFTPVANPVLLTGFVPPGTIGFSVQEDARRDALARLQGEAQSLCARRDPEFERLLEVDARPAEYRCANGPAGWSCALKYEANCQIERREQIERCPGAPTDAPATPEDPSEPRQ